MAGKRPITAPVILGVPDLDYDVEIKVRRKSTGATNIMYYPNVGHIQTDHVLSTEFGELGAEFITRGIPQVLLLMVGFNASPNTGHGVEIKDGGALGEMAGTEGGENGEEKGR